MFQAEEHEFGHYLVEQQLRLEHAGETAGADDHRFHPREGLGGQLGDELADVSCSTDGGASWHLYGSGLPMVVVSDLYMPTEGSFLRVSTYGRGVWETRF